MPPTTNVSQTQFTVFLPLLSKEREPIGIVDVLRLDDFDSVRPFVAKGYELTTLPNLGIGVRNNEYIVHSPDGKITPMTVKVEEAVELLPTKIPTLPAKRGRRPGRKPARLNPDAATLR
jgi:hypothetical protein